MSPGDYFGPIKPARELVLNQVSTAKIMTVANNDSASGLDILSKIKAAEGLGDSASLHGSTTKLNHNESAQQW